MATIIVEVDAKQAEAALKKLNSSIDNTGKKAQKGFDGAGASIGALAGPIGVATVGVGALTAAFVQLVNVAVTGLADITAEGVELASGLETARITFTNILGGNAEAAETFLKRLNQQSLQLGVKFSELSGFAKALLPDTESVDQFDRLTKVAVTLEKSDPDKTFDDVRIAIEGALSGDFVSLQDRFDLPKTTIQNIKNLQAELGPVEGIVAGLTAEFERTGQNLESFADTYAATVSRIEARTDTLKSVLGEPVLDALTEELSLFDSLLAENSDDIQIFVAQIGDMIAAVTDFIGTGLNDFLATIDFSQLEDLGITLQQTLAAVELIIDVLFEVPDSKDGIDRLTASIRELRNSLIAVAEFAGRVKLALEGTLILAKAVFQLKTGDIAGSFESLKDFTGLLDPERIKQSADETDAAFDRFKKRLVDISETQKERRQELERGPGDPTLIDAELEKKNAQKAAQEAEAAQKEIDAAQLKAAEDREKKLTDIQRREAQKRFDDEVKNAQKREDIARKNADALEDIFRKQDQRIAEASEDLSREEEDIARDGARERRQIERDAANERVEVERNFRQQLQDIQRQFNQSAQDAERANDAQAFLQAVRARDEQIEVAKSERDVDLEDVGRGAQEKREDLRTELAQEVEDAKIANARKIEDLNLRLQQEIEAQAIKNERDLEQQAIQEQRQKEQRDLAAQRALEDFERTEAEKQEKLNESLEKQFAILEAAKVKEIELTAMAEAEKTKIVAEEMERRARALAEAEEEAEQTSLPPLAAGIAPPGGITPMATGGPIAAGQTALVGEGGPEVFTAPATGHIIPNQTMFSPPSAAMPMAANINNSRNLSVGQMGINPGDGVLSRMVQNELSRFMEILG
ncbi:MAG: hypothetical protein ACYTFW_06605 [Planctomycetota bacterium]|jgi:hypothetical protein